jgi:hypothetical protein
VFGLAYGGAYAEYIAVSTHMLSKSPYRMPCSFFGLEGESGC